jgi:alcohol dehydrogenase class IV
MRFEFAASSRIVFGPGCLPEAIAAVAGYGKRVLLVTGMGNVLALRVESDFRERNLDVQVFQVAHEPTVELVQRGVRLAHAVDTQVVVGLGGGSAIDTAKAIAGLATNPGPVLDYLEVVGRGYSIRNPALPLVAVPTTAGTGSEVTKNAVLAVPERKVKVSLRSSFLVPRVAVIDPELTYTMPPGVTASTGMDALAQVIEPFVSTRANPMVDGFCREGMVRAGRSLLRAFQRGEDGEAREDMSYASLMGGLALANAGLGAVHGFAAPLGGMYPAAHGVLCARLLGPVVRVNYQALLARYPGHPAIVKYAEAARLVMGYTEERIEIWADWLEDLCQKMSIPRLADLGLKQDAFGEIAEKAAAASSMQANPVKLERDELIKILMQAL